MKVRLNKAHLDENLTGFLYLNTQPTEVAYIPKGDRELPEIILVYHQSIPSLHDEPELFDFSKTVEIKIPGRENRLKYPNATVVLIDDQFREKNKDLIGKLETLCVE